MGLVNRVFPPETLETGVPTLAQTIAGNAPLTIHAAKRTIDAFAGDPSDQKMQKLVDLVAKCFASEDYAEGRHAFREKRKPEFKGG